MYSKFEMFVNKNFTVLMSMLFAMMIVGVIHIYIDMFGLSSAQMFNFGLIFGCVYSAIIDLIIKARKSNES